MKKKIGMVLILLTVGWLMFQSDRSSPDAPQQDAIKETVNKETSRDADGRKIQDSLQTPEPQTGSTNPRVEETVTTDSIRLFGRVLMADTRQPVKNARVTITRSKNVHLNGAEVQKKMETDASGQFSFQVPPEGSWVYRAETQTHAFPIYPQHVGKPAAEYGRIQLDEGVVEAGPITILIEPVRLLKVLVKDKETDRPIEGAAIRPLGHGPHLFETDVDGRAILPLTPYLWNLRVAAPGYAQLRKTVDLGSQIQLVTFSLEKGGLVEGRVTAENGKPVKNARVMLRGGPQGMAMVNTDGNGEYLLNHQPLNVDLTLHCLSSRWGTFLKGGIRLTEVEPRQRQDITLDQKEVTGDLVFSGQLADGLGKPVQEASLTIFGAGGGLPEPELRNGAFEVANLAPDVNYQLTITAPGFQKKRQLFKGEPRDKVQRTVIVLEQGHGLTGRIMDPQGNGVQAMIQAVKDNSPRQSGKSDADGYFSLKNLPPKIDLVISSSGWSTHYEKDIELSRDDYEVVLKEQVAVFGRVVDAQTGKPVKRFEVKTQDRNHIPYAAGTPGSNVWREIVHENGDFVIDGLDVQTSVMVFIRAEGYRSDVFDRIKPGPEPRAYPLELVDRWVRGQVVDLQGNPRPGVRVHTRYYNPVTFPQGRLTLKRLVRGLGLRNLPDTTTDQNGQFSIEPAQEGFGFEWYLHQGGVADQVVKAAHLLMDEDLHVTVAAAQEAEITGICNLERYPDVRSVGLYTGNFLFKESGVDEKGGYHLRGLPEGPYIVALRTGENGQTPGKTAVDLLPGDSLRLDLGFEDAYALDGRALVGGTPMSDGRLTLLGLDPVMADRYYVMAETQADGAGRFQFHDLSPGDYAVTAFRHPTSNDRAPHHPNRVTFTVNNRDLREDFHFEAFPQITGVFKDDFQLGVQLVSAGTVGHPIQGETTADRFYFYDTPPGEYHLMIRGKSHDLALKRNLVVTVGQDQDLGELEVEPLGAVEIVLDGPSAADLTFTTEIFLEGKEDGLPMVHQLRNGPVLENIPAGMVKVSATARHEGMWRAGPVIVRVRSGITSQITLNLVKDTGRKKPPY